MTIKYYVIVKEYRLGLKVLNLWHKRAASIHIVLGFYYHSEKYRLVFYSLLLKTSKGPQLAGTWIFLNHKASITNVEQKIKPACNGNLMCCFKWNSPSWWLRSYIIEPYRVDLLLYELGIIQDSFVLVLTLSEQLES